MANVIGNLRAILSLNTRSFVAGLTTAGRATREFRGSMFNLGRGINKMGSFLAGFVAPGAAIYGLVNQFRELGDLSDLTERLNIDPKALQGFRLGAMDAGLAAEDTTTALQFMLKTVGEAAEGSKEAQKAVDGLGLSIQDLAASSSEEILYRIADALQQIPDASRRAAKEVDLFGRSGSRLDVALRGGRAGLKGFEKEMEGLGRSFSAEQLKKVDAAGNAFDRLKESLKGLGDVLIIGLGPKLESLFKGLTNVVSEGAGFKGGSTDAKSLDIDVLPLPPETNPRLINTVEARDAMQKRRDLYLQWQNIRSKRNRGFKLNDIEQKIFEIPASDYRIRRAMEESKNFSDRRSDAGGGTLGDILNVLQRIEQKTGMLA